MAPTSRGTTGPDESVRQTVIEAIRYAVSAVSNCDHRSWVDGIPDAADEVLADLRRLPVEKRMEAMGMENIGWTSEPYGDLHVLNEQEVAALDARADNGDPTFRGTFRPVYREAGRA